MLKILFFIIIFFVSNSYANECNICHAIEIKINEKVIENSEKYLYVREKTNKNDSPEINLWLKNCGLGKGYSYCQAFVSNMYKITFEEYKLKSPVPMSAGVAKVAEYCIKHPFDFKVISTKKMIWNIDKPEIGDIASFKRGTLNYNGFGYMGHAALVIKANDKNKTVDTIEGNTKAGNGGDQSGSKLGDFTGGQEGVYKRTRSLGLNSNFPIAYFIRLQKRILNI